MTITTNASTERETIRWDRVAAEAEARAEARQDPWSRRAGDRPKLTRREELLAHYAGKPITEYCQYDLAHMPGGDGLAEADDDGDIAYSTDTTELWNGFPVRIHIRRGTERETAIRLLRKALAWIEFDSTFQYDSNLTDDPWSGAAHGGVRQGCYRNPS